MPKREHDNFLCPRNGEEDIEVGGANGFQLCGADSYCRVIVGRDVKILQRFFKVLMVLCRRKQDICSFAYRTTA